MLNVRAVAFAVCFAFSLWPAHASAQSANLLDQMRTVFLQNVVLASTPAGVGVVAHTPVYATDKNVTDVTDLIDQLSRQIGSQASTFPLGSSSGGFTYTYDAALGTFSRTTDSFGPAFAERAVAIGKGRFSLGMNYLHTSFSSVDGQDLENGDLKFNLLHQVLSPPSFVQGDVVQAALHMKFTGDTAAFLFNYGVTDQLDLGFAVPIVRVNMDLTYQATILDFATRVTDPTRHRFANGTKTTQFSSTGSATGLGDIAILAKYNFLRRGSQAVAAAIDVRVPSGDETNMLGSGSTLTKVFLIASGTMGSGVSPHVNVGYTVANGGTDPADQVNYVGGVEFAVAPRVTIIGDVIGRTVRDTFRFEEASQPHQFTQGAGLPVESTTILGVASRKASLNTALAAVGVKLNPAASLLISAHVLIPMTDAGLRARPTPVIGFDYSF